VALRVRLLRKAPASRIGELRTEDEEGRGHLGSVQDFEDLLGDPGLGPVVEGESDLRPWHES
jgi:hypothetical protein